MRFKNMKFQVILPLLIIFLLSACNQEEAVKNNSQTKQHKMNTHHIVGKPQAPVSLNYEFIKAPVLDETLQIELKLSTEQESELLQVNYTTTSLLDSADVIQSQSFTNVAKGQQVSYVIHVIPKQLDLSYVNVFVATTFMGKKQSRAFAIPVSTGEVLPSSVLIQKKSPDPQVPQGFEYNQQQNIIIMPATDSP